MQVRRDAASGSDTVLVVVNLDPHQPREATVWLDRAALGSTSRRDSRSPTSFPAQSYRWGQANYVRLDPASAPAHIFTVSADQPGTGTGQPDVRRG